MLALLTWMVVNSLGYQSSDVSSYKYVDGPKFLARQGLDNPFIGIQNTYNEWGVHPPIPTFADLDGDGDLDFMLGVTLAASESAANIDQPSFNGSVSFLEGLRYFENIGTSRAAVYAERTHLSENIGHFNTTIPHSPYWNPKTFPVLIDINDDGECYSSTRNLALSLSRPPNLPLIPIFDLTNGYYYFFSDDLTNGYYYFFSDGK